ncbi:MAG TPA: endonuclease III [Cytophagales bacterium]|nr:endonuclease III [Cytophagales bacterium]
MTKKERYKKIIDYFVAHQPNPETELFYTNPFELIVAVVLSAQCTDKRVNMVTPALFRDFPNAEALAKTDFETLYPYVKSISYPGNKTKHLIGLGKMLVNEFGSHVPSGVESLIKLPGVGRKTANVIDSIIYEKPALAVDTHVYRVSKRLGLVPESLSTPLAVEKELVKNLPERYVSKAHHWLILHGRYICLARKPKCEECPLTEYCRYFSKYVANKITKLQDGSDATTELLK